jgi:sigma-B regulation protein RsbU (phosphoserine phosphatase)
MATQLARTAAFSPVGHAQDLAGRRILLVDDDDSVQALLAHLLRDAGYHVEAARNGQEALRLARRSPPDLVLLDVMMPGRDGFSVMEALQSEPGTASVPVIFLSARGSAPDRVEGLRRGAVDYVVKPIDSAELLQRVAIHLDLRRQRLEHQTLRTTQTKLKRDLAAAGRVQRQMLQTCRDDGGAFLVDHRFQPAAAVGGDLLGAFEIDPEHLALFVLDVSGHGISSALVTSALGQVFRPGSEHLVRTEGGQATAISPARVLERLGREYVVDRTGHLVTMVYALVHRPTGSVRLASAGHPPPMVVRSEGRLQTIEGGGPLLGALDAPQYAERWFALEPGDKLLLYSDGLSDVGAPAGSTLDAEALHDVLAEHCRSTPHELLDALERRLLQTRDGRSPDDDVSLLCLQHAPAQADSSQPAHPSEHMLALSKHLGEIGTLRRWVGSHCATAGQAEAETSAVVLGAVEAFTNIVRHEPGDPWERIRIRLRTTPEKLELVLQSPGTPAGPSGPQVPVSTQHDFPQCAGGMGLVILHALLDEVRWDAQPEGAKALTLVKYRFLEADPKEFS